MHAAPRGSPVIVKVIPAQKSADDIAREAAEREEKLETDRWSISLTAAIVVVAFMQFCGIIGQIVVYRRQAKIMSGQLNAATKAANAAELQTEVLFKQWDAVEKQRSLLREQFFAEHRPKLIVRDVFFATPRAFEAVVYELANTGGSVAKIIGGYVGVHQVKDFRDFKRLDSSAVTDLAGTEIKPGQLEFFAVKVSAAIQIDLEAAPRRGPDIQHPHAGGIYFFGILSYVDARGEEFGTVRASIFRRQWDLESASFRRTGNPDHEYAD